MATFTNTSKTATTFTNTSRSRTGIVNTTIGMATGVFAAFTYPTEDIQLYEGALPTYTNLNKSVTAIAITIDHTKVAGTLTDYPLYLDLSTLDATFWARVQNGGGDIRFTSSDGTTELAREIVSCDTATDTGEVYVKVPSVSSTTDTVIYLYYGDPDKSDYAASDTYGSQNVWGSNAKYIGHFQGNANDSSANGNDGSLRGITTGAAIISDSLQMLGMTTMLDQNSGTDVIGFGQATNYRQIAQSFVCPADMTLLKEIIMRKAANTGTPATSITGAICADNAGSPGTVLASGSWSVGGSGAWNTLSTSSDSYLHIDASSLVPGTTYWIRFSSGSSDTDHPNIYYNAAGAYGTLKEYDGSNWNTIAGNLKFALATGDDVALASTVVLTYNSFSMSWRMKRSSAQYENIFTNVRGDGSGYVAVDRTLNSIKYESTTNNIYDKNIPTGITVNDNAWHYYTIVSGSSNFKLYVDGSLASTQTANTDTASQRFRYIGTKGAYPYLYGRGFTGYLDEVRMIETTQLSADYITTEYNNQSSPATFYTTAYVGSTSGFYTAPIHYTNITKN